MYRVAAREGLDGFREVMRGYALATDPNEKERLMLAAASVTDPASVREAIASVLPPPPSSSSSAGAGVTVAAMDVRSFLGHLARQSMDARRLVWAKVKDPAWFQALYAYVNGGTDVQSSRLARLVSDVGGGFAEDVVIAEAEALMAAHPDWVPASKVDAVREKVRKNKLWIADNLDGVCEWVRAQQ